MSRQKKGDGTAVWIFVAATFVAVFSVVLPSPAPGHWTTVAGIAIAVALLVLGGIVLGREIRNRSTSAD